MKTGSRRGAALAYVIVISAALMILAAGLLTAATFNVDASQNSLEGRQAYLDAKSSIEFGRAYLKLHPTSGSFSIVKTDTETGFAIKLGAQREADAITFYDSTQKVMNAAAQYNSSDRVRRLGYQYTVTQTPPTQPIKSIPEYLVTGSNFGSQYVFSNWWHPLLYPNVSTDYPVFFANYLHVEKGEHYLTAPEVILIGINSQNSLQSDYGAHVALTTDVVYIQKNLTGSPGDIWNQNSTSRFILNSLTNGRGVIVFGSNCMVSGLNRVTILKGCYAFKNGVDLFQLNSDPASDLYVYKNLTKLSTIPDYAVLDQDMIDSPEQVVSGDMQGDNSTHGTHWSSNGKITVSNGNYPRYIQYEKSIDKSWINNGNPIIKNYKAGLDEYEKKIVSWYLNDVSGWENVLWGNNNDDTNDYYENVANVYLAKKLTVQYVNSTKDFVVPAFKTVVFQADKITLNTQKTDTELGDSDSKPRITYENADEDKDSGYFANFILKSTDGNSDLSLTFPNDTVVHYSDPKAIEKRVYKQTYTIKAGKYLINSHISSQDHDFTGIGINLFSHKAEEYFANEKNRDPIDGGSDSGGGDSGGTTLSGGVYTDGQ